jgi:thiamine-phosphate pyrophosphorylase
MPARCLLYYITDRTAFPGDESTRKRRLLEKISEAASAGVDYIQLREKDLPTRELESLAREAASILRERAQLRTENRELRTALLINSRADVAMATGADGVHLRSDDISPQEVRAAWQKCGAGTPFDKLSAGSARQLSPRGPLIGVSCHFPAEVTQAAANVATFAVFAPIFEKKDAHRTPPTGLAALAEACRTRIPVLALGGVTLENAQQCRDAGAAGIAAIRLFQENDISAIAKHLRG